MPISRKRKQTKEKTGFKPNEQLVDKWEWIVGYSQAFVLPILGARMLVYGPNLNSLHGQLLYWGGALLALGSWCYIFIPNRFWRRRVLLTKGVFKYTRHPMYTGAAMVDLSLWSRNHFSPGFFISATLLYTAMILVGWLQEQEVLEKFGPAAKEYYARTPRLFFMYPFMKKD